MAWPPVIPPATRANATPILDTHPADHNAISTALTDITTRVNPSVWTALPFNAGWSSYGGAYNAGQYRRNGDRIELRGIVKHSTPSGPSGQIIATLPAGFRPPASIAIAVIAGAGMGQVELRANGDIVFGGSVVGSPTSANIALDGMWGATV